jgi:hypothetical protein
MNAKTSQSWELFVSIMIGLVLIGCGYFAKNYNLLNELLFGLVSILFSCVLFMLLNNRATMKKFKQEQWFLGNYLDGTSISFDLFFNRIPSLFSYELIDLETIKINDPYQIKLFWKNTIYYTQDCWQSTNVCAKTQILRDGEHEAITFQSFLAQGKDKNGKQRTFTRVFLFENIDEAKENLNLMESMEQYDIKVKCCLCEEMSFKEGMFAGFKKKNNDFVIIDDKYLVQYDLDEDNRAVSVLCTHNNTEVKEAKNKFSFLQDFSYSLTQIKHKLEGE